MVEGDSNLLPNLFLIAATSIMLAIIYREEWMSTNLVGKILKGGTLDL